jgi:hypothetical protein
LYFFYVSKECFKIDYDMEVSQSEYLTDWYVNYIKLSIKPFLNNHNESPISSRISSLSRAFPQNASVEEIRQNIVSVKIFYNNLNYKLISDVPQQNWINFLATCGGVLGGSLLGMSVITLVELIELFLRICKILISKVFKKVTLVLALGSFLKPKDPLL